MKANDFFQPLRAEDMKKALDADEEVLLKKFEEAGIKVTRLFLDEVIIDCPPDKSDVFHKILQEHIGDPIGSGNA